MTALDLYKFIEKNDLTYSYRCDGDIDLFVYNNLIQEWNNLLKSNIFYGKGIKCVMKDGHFIFRMKKICKYFGIKMSEVFASENEE